VVRPRRAPDGLVARLLESGRVRLLEAPLARADLDSSPPPARELERVAARIRALLGTDRSG
jgi:hypothetical protein